MQLLTVDRGLRLEQYLDMEQQMLHAVEQECMFTWTVSPTVIYGRHQVREQEVNEDYCTAHHVRVIQRKSGGGCVYADEGNLMISYLTPCVRPEEAFDRFMHIVLSALEQLGYPALSSERNDILVDGRKVAGTACYTTPHGTIVHASMLYDTDLNALEAALIPPREKLVRHAVQSVRQRVRNLREIRDIGDMDAFRNRLEKAIKQQ